MPLTFLIPILVFIAVVLLLLGSPEPQSDSPHPWQGRFLIAITIWGAYLALLTEGLSQFKGLSRWPIAVGWLLALIVVLAVGVRSGRLRRGYQFVFSGLRSLNRLETGLLVAIASLSFLLLAVAVVTPTNNVDAMNYHMPRVLQWAQNRTLAHFPTMHESQNIRPYWAEAVILNFRVLWGNDQPAGLAQWMIMVSSLIATSGIARLLGGDRKAQWLTAVLAFSIPIGLLQSTTTQNDYVSAFWVVCLAYFVILSRQRQLSRLELLGLGLSLGLGMLTKGTFIPYSAPLMVWFFLGRLSDRRWRRIFIEGIALILVVLATNGLFWSRNIQSTGGPYGAWNPLQLLKGLLPNRAILPDTSSSIVFSGTGVGYQTREELALDGTYVESSGLSFNIQPAPILDLQSNRRLAQFARLVAMNFVSPFSAFNEAYFRFLRTQPEYFPEHWVRKLEDAAWNHEDTAGSPVHLTLILLAMIMGGYRAVRGRFRFGLAYALVLAVSFILISLVGSGVDIFVIRYQLGFLVLGTPLVGLLFSSWDRVGFFMAVFLLLYSLPYILVSNMRPVIGHRPWPTRVDSVFMASKTDLLFAINPGIQDEYGKIADQIMAKECKEVGLSYSRNNLEYQIWYLLDSPQNGISIRHLVSLPAFDSERDPSFSPCAVVCTACDALPDEYMLPVSSDYGNVRLYLRSDIR